MVTTEQVLVEFLADYSQLDSAAEALVKTGAIDQQMANSFKLANAEIKKQVDGLKVVNSALKPIKPSLEGLSTQIKKTSSDFIKGFEEGMLRELQKAGVSLEDFFAKLTDGSTLAAEGPKTVKAELRGLVEEIARAKAEGKDYGDEYDSLVKKAGHLKDAIADVNQTVKTTGSDTRVFDGLISGMQGVAGAAAIAQGTTALFGDESEDMQKTLLKVNAAMSILQGLQSVQNVLQKESAVSLLLLTVQQKVQNAQLLLENGLQSRSIVVRLAAATAQKVLNAAMAANPIGIVVVALAALIALVAEYSSNTREAARETAHLNAVLAANTAGLEADLRAYEEAGRRRIATLEASGAVESEIQKASAENEELINRKKLEALQNLIKERDKLLVSESDDAAEKTKEYNAEIQKLDSETSKFRTDKAIAATNLEKSLRTEALKSYAAGIETQLLRAEEGSEQQLALQRKLIAARAALELNADGLLATERDKIRAAAVEEDKAAQAAAAKRKLDVQAQQLENELVNVKAGSAKEVNLRLQLLKVQENAELSSTTQSEEEKQAIRDKYAQLRIKTQEEYNKELLQKSIQMDIDRNNAELANIQINDSRRLELQIENINSAAEAEVAAAEENAAKIAAINAKREADILAIKRQFLEQALEYEISLAAAENGPEQRRLQRLAANEKKGLSIRLDAMQQLTDMNVSEIDKRLSALWDEQDQGLISEKEYTLKLKQLLDERRKVVEENQVKTEELQTESTIKRINNILSVAQAVEGVFATLADIATQKDNDRVAAMQAALDEAKESGAITEKEAILRQKRIDQEERKARLAAAQREKSLAVFDSLIKVPQATLQGLITGGPVLAAIYGGIALAQALLIATRPIPKFRHGKKDRYQGWGEIGEAGAEIHERSDGSMYVAKKPTITWIGEKDKVYTAMETRKMLSRPTHEANKDLIAQKVPAAEKIDYERIGKSIGKHSRKIEINITKDFVSEAVEDGLSKVNYYNKRYSFR